MIQILILIVLGYLIGAIPTGWLLARSFGISDITRYGSGSSGATNVARIAGLKYFFIVLFFDSAKAFLFIHWLRIMHYNALIVFMCAIALMVGNSISFFLQGKGGKGIATALGILLALNGWLVYCTAIVWFSMFFMTKNVGIASVAGLLSLPLFAFYWVSSDTMLLCLIIFICCWGLWRHETNIKKYFSLDKASI